MAANLPSLIESNFVKLVKYGPKFLKKIKRVDPQDRYVVLFPDSKNVHVRMGFNLLNSPAAEKAYIEANKYLNSDFFKLCLDGPEDDLKSSLINKNLAAYVTSHATMAKLAENEPDSIRFCTTAGGVGIGVINSLVFSQAMSFTDGLELVHMYSKAMEEAARIVPAEKITLKLWPATSKKKFCLAAIESCLKKGVPKEIAVCSVVEYLKPQVVVVGGHKQAIDFLKTDGVRLFGYKILDNLTNDKSGYNTELMRPAANFIEGYLKQKTTVDPRYLKEPETCSVYSSTCGFRLRSKETVLRELISYPVRPIKTEQLLQTLFSRVKSIHQPKILVLWDTNLMRTLRLVNRKAWSSAKLIKV